jgi:hypothetical protein
MGVRMAKHDVIAEFVTLNTQLKNVCERLDKFKIDVKRLLEVSNKVRQFQNLQGDLYEEFSQAIHEVEAWF